MSLSSAERGEVAFARAAALVPRGGVVQVTSGGGTAAARRGACRVAGADQGAGGVVADLAMGVVAGAAGRWGSAGSSGWGEGVVLRTIARRGAWRAGAGWGVVAWWSGAWW